jgi:hypothetical protein
VGPSLGIVLVAAAVAGAANSSLEHFELVAQDLGSPRLAAFSVASYPVPGWALRPSATYPWVQTYFGKDSTWNRYVYSWKADRPAATSYQSVSPVILDIISTSDLSTFSTYGIEACYRFHNFQILEARRVDLGAGVIGHAVVYHNQELFSNWTAVYWEWPVKTPVGQRYERVILNMDTPRPPQVRAPSDPTSLVSRLQLAIGDALGGGSGDVSNPDSARVRDFLVSFGHEVVLSAANASPKAPTGQAT